MTLSEMDLDEMALADAMFLGRARAAMLRFVDDMWRVPAWEYAEVGASPSKADWDYLCNVRDGKYRARRCVLAYLDGLGLLIESERADAAHRDAWARSDTILTYEEWSAEKRRTFDAFNEGFRASGLRDPLAYLKQLQAA